VQLVYPNGPGRQVGRVVQDAVQQAMANQVDEGVEARVICVTRKIVTRENASVGLPINLFYIRIQFSVVVGTRIDGDGEWGTRC
jgi:predicted proteasome-type protease